MTITGEEFTVRIFARWPKLSVKKCEKNEREVNHATAVEATRYTGASAENLQAIFPRRAKTRNGEMFVVPSARRGKLVTLLFFFTRYTYPAGREIFSNSATSKDGRSIIKAVPKLPVYGWKMIYDRSAASVSSLLGKNSLLGISSGKRSSAPEKYCRFIKIL